MSTPEAEYEAPLFEDYRVEDRAGVKVSLGPDSYVISQHIVNGSTAVWTTELTALEAMKAFIVGANTEGMSATAAFKIEDHERIESIKDFDGTSIIEELEKGENSPTYVKLRQASNPYYVIWNEYTGRNELGVLGSLYTDERLEDKNRLMRAIAATATQPIVNNLELVLRVIDGPLTGKSFPLSSSDITDDSMTFDEFIAYMETPEE